MSYVSRHLQAKIIDTLKTGPVLFLNGPRQAGKSTLVRRLADTAFPAEYVSFDNATQMAAAVNSPETFLRARNKGLIIDEVQLAPEIFRELKILVDEFRQQNWQGETDLKPKFLLTGSANIMALPKLADALVGRMHILTLYPLAASEVTSGKSDFIERLFAGRFMADKNAYALKEVICTATFPEIHRATEKTRTNWFNAYLTTILQRDVRALAEITRLSSLPNLLRILAARAGSLINDADIARDARLNAMTSRNYKTLLSMLFLTFEVRPWYRNIGKRLVKSAKGYLIDTLLLCHLLQYRLEDLEKNRPEIFGHVLENFVATELVKLMAIEAQNMELYHFRTSDNKEVDFVIEKPDGHLVGIEVKNSDRANAADFKGLSVLQSLVGTDFICGVVLYRGREAVPFGKNLWAVPIANLFDCGQN